MLLSFKCFSIIRFGRTISIVDLFIEKRSIWNYVVSNTVFSFTSAFIDDWHAVSRSTGLDRTCPKRTDIVRNGHRTDMDCDNKKIIASSMVRIFHHIVSCEAFYVHNNRTQDNRTRRVIAPPQGGYSHFLWIHRRGPSFYPETQKITEICWPPPKNTSPIRHTQKNTWTFSLPQKLHVFIFFMPIGEILSHPYDLSCWWDVKSQINQPTEHVTIQLVYVGTRK